MKRFKRCVLHIGTVKTGTKTIQTFLSRNRLTLAKEGAIYPRSTGERGGSQWGFVACVQTEPWTSDMSVYLGIRTPADRNTYRDALMQSLRKEFRKWPRAELLIISSEHLSCRLTTIDDISRLKAFLEPWASSFEVVMYLRRQDRLAVSLYSTKIKGGHTEANVLSYDPHYHDYDRIYNNWRCVFGQDSVHVRLFDRAELIGADLLRDFCSLCRLNMAGKQIPSPRNQSLNQAGLDFLVELNRQLPWVVNGTLNEERRQLVSHISKLCTGKCELCSREEAVAFYRQFLEGNERLRQEVFPGRPAPLFDEDFSEYPERLDIETRNYGDAVRLAIAIWSSRNCGGVFDGLAKSAWRRLRSIANWRLESSNHHRLWFTKQREYAP